MTRKQRTMINHGRSRESVLGNRGRDPKPKSLTPQQEHELELAEAVNCRARIYELGVAALLNTDNQHYACAGEIAVAAEVLQAAVGLRRQADRHRLNSEIGLRR